MSPEQLVSQFMKKSKNYSLLGKKVANYQMTESKPISRGMNLEFQPMQMGKEIEEEEDPLTLILSRQKLAKTSH